MVSINYQQLRTVGLSLVLSSIVWIIFTWPLPAHLSTVIPSGFNKSGHHLKVQPMLPGDHLQLDYHFWLLTDMLSGHTPWFYNLYEFNTGDDHERYEPGSYYLPFSFFYALGSYFAGRAFGWNFSIFISLWLTVLFTQILVGRYTKNQMATWAASVLAITMPYRWIMLLGGSPTGFSMMWVPILLLGIDIAVLNDDIRGGWLAGIALLFAAWGDAHTFFFSALIIPCWCIFVFIQRSTFVWTKRRSYFRVMRALLPVIVLASVALFTIMTTSRQINEAKTLARTIPEIALFSPHPGGLLGWTDRDSSEHIFLGYMLMLWVVIGLIMLWYRPVPERGKQLMLVILLLLGVAGIILLALGPYSPFSGRFFTAARKFIPHYNMIRQPSKVYCLLPSIIAVLFVLLAERMRIWVLCFFCLGIFLEFRLQGQPTLCDFSMEQNAYRAIAEMAEAKGEIPHVLVVPFWPGDSHYTSIYQHYASIYRLRLVNGYRPFVSQKYIDTIFHRFESVNLGFVDDAQLDDLQARGINFIILHEDFFPEKVNPFGAIFTLKQLLNNSRLKLIQQDGPVWSFQILSQPVIQRNSLNDWKSFFSTHYMELEKGRIKHAQIGASIDAMGGNFVELHKPGDIIGTRIIYVVPAPGLRWLIRLRGQGSVQGTSWVGNDEQSYDMKIHSKDWEWYLVPCTSVNGFGPVSLTLECKDGFIDADTVVIAAGIWHPLYPGTAFSAWIPFIFNVN